MSNYRVDPGGNEEEPTLNEVTNYMDSFLASSATAAERIEALIGALRNKLSDYPDPRTGEIK